MIFPYLKKSDDPKPPSALPEALGHFFGEVAPKQSLLAQKPAPAKAPVEERLIFALPVAANGSNAHQLAEMRIRHWVLQQEMEYRRTHGGRALPTPGRRPE